MTKNIELVFETPIDHSIYVGNRVMVDGVSYGLIKIVDTLESQYQWHAPKKTVVVTLTPIEE